MGGGRKNIKRRIAAAAGRDDGVVDLRPGHTIMQVLSLRGSNLIEVMDAKGVNSLALFPAKFQRSLWIKNGSFVVVDASGMEKALESGSKVACIVTQVLYHDQLRLLQKSPEWPDIFKQKVSDEVNVGPCRPVSHSEESSLSDEDGLPPIEANTNRSRPPEFHSDPESESE